MKINLFLFVMDMVNSFHLISIFSLSKNMLQRKKLNMMTKKDIILIPLLYNAVIVVCIHICVILINKYISYRYDIVLLLHYTDKSC